MGVQARRLCADRGAGMSANPTSVERLTNEPPRTTAPCVACPPGVALCFTRASARSDTGRSRHATPRAGARTIASHASSRSRPISADCGTAATAVSGEFTAAGSRSETGRGRPARAFSRASGGGRTRGRRRTVGARRPHVDHVTDAGGRGRFFAAGESPGPDSPRPPAPGGSTGGLPALFSVSGDQPGRRCARNRARATSLECARGSNPA